MATLRPAQAADQETIRRIVRAARINPMDLHWQHFLVAEQEGRIVGTGQIKRHGDGSRELASIAVIPECQGRGIAGSIIGELMGREPPPLFLTCRAPLEPFYVRFGFHRVSPAEMTPYFRRIYRLADIMIRVFRLADGMRVMKWEGPSYHE